ncbi:MAG TPA: SWIM zinc finger family protein [Opitutaceae bacterium]|jgi:uncharacterized Zn finger protein
MTTNMGWEFGWRPYTPMAVRRANAAREASKLSKTGRKLSPVAVGTGRQIARTFWGKAWCDHLESHSDFANRLPRGRTYVRNGSVIDLRIKPGRICALVSGSQIYKIEIKIKTLPAAHWGRIKRECAGKITSVMDLLQGRLSGGTMEIVTHRQTGLFPKPAEISLDCSCPDWADMCKHVAAALYGIGARLDEDPALLFRLRGVDHSELIATAAEVVRQPLAGESKPGLADGELAEVFGIEMAAVPPAPSAGKADRAAKAAKPPRKKTAAKQIRSPKPRSRRAP